MFDHVTIATADLDASERFYSTVLRALGYEAPKRAGGHVRFGDFSIARADERRRATTGLHVAFVAPSRAAMEAFWRAGIEAGHPDAGIPGPRPEYGGDYEGAFLLDPDGNSAEATFHGDRRTDRRIDHLWIRVADLAASRRFYATVADVLGLREVEHLAGRTRYARGDDDGTFSILDGRTTTPFGLAFSVADHAAVEEFHRAATSAGHPDDGPPGEWHPRCFNASVLDPDGHRVEAVAHER